MRQKPGPQARSATQVVKDIRRRTRKHHSSEEKIRVVLQGLRGENSIAGLCRREGIATSLYYSWSKEFLEAGKKRLAGDTARQASSPEVKELRTESTAITEALADVMLENLDAPGWVFPTLLIVIVVGFPIALIIAWAFELTPDGIKRDRAEATPGPATRGQYLQLAIIVVLAVAVGVLVVDKFNGDSQAPGPTLERSLAVLPFTNRSANVDDAFFVDGMHDDILTQLAKLATMDKVISQRTAEAYRDTTKSPQQIADELGVEIGRASCRERV